MSYEITVEAREEHGMCFSMIKFHKPDYEIRVIRNPAGEATFFSEKRTLNPDYRSQLFLREMIEVARKNISSMAVDLSEEYHGRRARDADGDDYGFHIRHREIPGVVEIQAENLPDYLVEIINSPDKR